MRVVIDGVIYGRKAKGGIARYWTEVLEAMQRLESPVHLDLVVPIQAQRPAGFPCRTIGSLSAYWAAWRADVFHSTYYTRWPRMKCPSVATAYDFVDANFPEFKPNGPGFVDRQLDVFRRASAVIAISKSTRDWAVHVAGLDPARVFVAYPGVAAPFADPLPQAEEIRRYRQERTGGAPYLLHVGKRRTYKNFLTILRAFGRATLRTERHLLVFGGPADRTAEETEALAAGRMAERIHFIPQADDAELRLAYAGADAMVHASLMEGFGIPVIEALACGTGLILSDIPVYREIADPMAEFVPPTDTDAWACALAAPVPVRPHWREDVLRRYQWMDAARVHAQAYAFARSHPATDYSGNAG